MVVLRLMVSTVANTDLTTLIQAIQRCIATTDNPFASEKPDTRQLTINAIERLTGEYCTADITTALTAEAERLTGFTQRCGGMLAYELSLPYREALYNCNAAIAHLQKQSAD
ncbi:MAG: hypothetical protein KKE08_08960 [Gammaproteobacteria bacterium]|nr:hypothetical protein [Gammaproteobacteria bacterium]MBU2183140.1 hypothetical protein [Gammaproteobacteria bacterium]MBU2203778.1 hypothetical protein [Gammaproteobacteria bacterium]